MGEDLVIDGRLGEYLVIEAVSKNSNLVMTGVGILGEDFVIDGRSGEDYMIEAVSTIRNSTLLLTLSLFEWTELWFLSDENIS